MMKLFLLCLCFSLSIFTVTSQPVYDIIIRHGIIYDGSGNRPFRGDVAILGDSIAAIGDFPKAKAKQYIDATNLAVAPGFINMLSWANGSLIQDGRSLSDIRQGVTLEVMGEGRSMGPVNEEIKRKIEFNFKDYNVDVKWSTLGGYLNYLEQKGVACNVASYIGATSVREFVIGEDDRQPTAVELDSMKALVRQAMLEGALGVGSSLIYPPAFFASTEELIALSKVAGEYGGGYISHIRSEGNNIYEALEELIQIGKEAEVHAEIYHLKTAGRDNWQKMDSVIRRITRARQEGIDVAANMYVYEAGATGLTASFPPSLQDGGFGKLWERLHDPSIREEMRQAMKSNPKDWENLYYAAGSPDRVLLLGFSNDSLKKYAGKSLAEMADIRGTSPEETAMDLIIQDSSRVGTAYFLMSEGNIEKEIALPWMSFGSDAGSLANEGVFLESSTHPRAYGNVARLLGKYVRNKKIITLPEAIYRLTKLSAEKLHITRRGELKDGYFADVVIFDPARIQDHATYAVPHQYATGVKDVIVNGQLVLKNGEPTNATPGRFVKGPGYVGAN